MARTNSSLAGKTASPARQVSEDAFRCEGARFPELDAIVARIKARNAHLDQQAIMDLIDEEVDAVRAGRS